jgi:hypothetical protein
MTIFCVNTDFDYHRKKRLNNGNYLVMTTQGIYLYNEKFNSKVDIEVFDSRIIKGNDELYSSDIAQFSTEDNGYIICLIKNETYFLSKKGELLQHITLDYIIYRSYYNIIPYGHSYNEYYFVIITLDEPSHTIVIRKYKFNALNNEINFIQSYDYEVASGIKESITCELMNSLGDKVIACFYSQWDDNYYSVFDITDFNIFSNYTGKISKEGGIDGAQLLVSTILPENRENVMVCQQKERDYKCFKYNIINNAFTDATTITSSGCEMEIVRMEVEYFPETKEIVAGCKGVDGQIDNYFYIGKFNLNNEFSQYQINIQTIS